MMFMVMRMIFPQINRFLSLKNNRLDTEILALNIIKYIAINLTKTTRRRKYKNYRVLVT